MRAEKYFIKNMDTIYFNVLILFSYLIFPSFMVTLFFVNASYIRGLGLKKAPSSFT